MDLMLRRFYLRTLGTVRVNPAPQTVYKGDIRLMKNIEVIEYCGSRRLWLVDLAVAYQMEEDGSTPRAG
jgi:hypothetical protein